MVWSCEEEQWWIYWTKGDKHGAGRQEERRKTTEEDAKYRVISYQVFPAEAKFRYEVDTLRFCCGAH